MPDKSELDRHKSRIVALFAENKLEDVIRMMGEDGFMASSSEYCTQLNHWGVRKNLKKSEWRAAMRRLDILTSRHRKIRLIISGRVVPEQKIQLVRRRYCQDRPSYARASLSAGDSGSVPECVSFEANEGDQRWSPCTNIDGNSMSQDPSTPDRDAGMLKLMMPDISSSDPRLGFNSSMEQQEPEVSGSLPTEGVDSPLQDENFQDLGMAVSGREDLIAGASNTSVPDLPWQFITQSPEWPEQYRSGHNNPLSPFWNMMSPGSFRNHEAPPQPFELLRGLPFSRFERLLETNSIVVRDLLPKVQGYHLVYGLHQPITQFLMDAADMEYSRPNTRRCNAIAYNFSPRPLLQSFETLLPGEVPREQDDLVSRNEAFATKFVRLLMFSTVNSFSGLEDIPTSSVIKLLGRYGNLGAFISQILKKSPGYAAKALAENLLKAAIEAQDGTIIKLLLEGQYVDVNKTICDVDGEKFTAIERTTVLQSLQLTALLLESKADVKRTFSSHPSGMGPLARLIHGIPLGSTITRSTISLVQLLLDAGAKLDMIALRQIFEHLHGGELLYLLVPMLSAGQHTDLISGGILSLVAEHLEDEEALEATQVILQACQQTHEGNCLVKFTGKLDWALIQAAIKGHLQLVRILLPYSRSLEKVLSAAVRSGKRELIDLILTKKPDLNAAAHIIDMEHWNPMQAGLFRSITTPLAEAIKTCDENLIQLFENLSQMSHLNCGGKFEAVIAAAAKMGNVQYVHKLLHHHPWPNPEEMSDALLYSIQSGHEEIFHTLLNAVADVNKRREKLLAAALFQRNEGIVHAILEADIGYGEPQQVPFVEAIRWGNRSIIMDLFSTFPIMKLDSYAFVETLKTGNIDLFDFIVEKGLMGEFELTHCLEVAISRGDTKMLFRLIELGANPSGPRILALAAEKQPGMLPLFLAPIVRSKRRFVPGFGTCALKIAIRQGLPGLDVVDILLSSEGIDTDGFEEGSFSSTEELRPLGLAIKESRTHSHANVAIIRRLLKAGCNPNNIVILNTIPIVSNQTGLLAAIQTKSEDLVQLLIDHGADVNREPRFGVKLSPLQQAAKLGCLDIVRLLLKKGANPNARPAVRSGGTALQFAAMSGNWNIAAELLSHGADLQAAPSKLNGRWPLEGAAEHGRLEMIEFLWKASGGGFDDKQCDRAMKLAESNGHFGCQDLITELSASKGAFTNFSPLGNLAANLWSDELDLTAISW